MVSSETVYRIGLILLGFSVLIIAIAVPVFIFTGNRIKKQLEDEYGEKTNHGDR